MLNAVTGGLDHTCVLTATSGVQCWGWSRWGIYDDESPIEPAPVSMAGIDGAIQAVAVGGEHLCVLTNRSAAAGDVQCWGVGYSGQLGVNPGWSPLDVLALQPRVLFAPIVRQ